MLVTVSGKGGVGKTTLTALIVDELLRQEFLGRMLIVDADPAQTLHFALGVNKPGVTLAEVRDETPLNAAFLRDIFNQNSSPGEFIRRKLVQDGVISKRMLRQKPFDLLAMGHGESAGCYCTINRALGDALESILDGYDLIIVDCEAGLEHLSRLRIKAVDLFLSVSTPGRASLAVSRQVEEMARQAGMDLKETGVIFNKMTPSADKIIHRDDFLAVVGISARLLHFDETGRPATELPDPAQQRIALLPVIDRLRAIALTMECVECA